MQWQINLNCAAGKNKPLFGSIPLRSYAFTVTLRLGAAIPTERRMANADWAKPLFCLRSVNCRQYLARERREHNRREGAPKGPYFLKVRQLDKINILSNLGRSRIT